MRDAALELGHQGAIFDRHLDGDATGVAVRGDAQSLARGPRDPACFAG